MDQLIQNVQDVLTRIQGYAWIVVAVAIGLLLVVVVLRKLFSLLRRKRPRGTAGSPLLDIDVPGLGDRGPAPGPPSLEFYNIPVRVAAIVLAPAGRASALPPANSLPEVFDAIVPGLDRIIAIDDPLIRRWPNQLSVHGFAHTFFAHVRLPGSRGKGTPWSSAAGLFEFHDFPMVVGLVFCAAAPNSFGQTTIDSEEKWLGCLRVRQSS